ncbi:ABC transporter permease [Litorihabitans aurantiacus]|uniref:ABC transporter type 1 GsiC-like N-terminal domain-containing protein n=1 Tax=Litorihabitans aurantiacus TaxID=1930061 RepID=A0AA37UPW2_9MICO|nr:ABC transporter permease [Litorihabitans aurantiacus]GMA30896.1 hypothetical protein GCM10025875_08880 [Litorihabitans aurantiacus]
MPRYIASRAARAVATLVAVLVAAFVLARLSGDPVRLLLPPEATPEQVEAARASLGLDRPVLQQLLDFLLGAARGDFGTSVRQGTSALGVVLERLPFTLELALVSFVLGLVIAVGLAVWGELSGSPAVRGAMLWIATARQAVPPYLFGILLILVFAVWWGCCPRSAARPTPATSCPSSRWPPSRSPSTSGSSTDPSPAAATRTTCARRSPRA